MILPSTSVQGRTNDIVSMIFLTDTRNARIVAGNAWAPVSRSRSNPGVGCRIMTTTPDTDPILAEIVQRLVELLQPERIYLFGSRARGDAGPDSDYDLMVVVSRLTEPAYRLAQRAHSVLWGLDTAADIGARRRTILPLRASHVGERIVDTVHDS